MMEEKEMEILPIGSVICLNEGKVIIEANKGRGSI